MAGRASSLMGAVGDLGLSKVAVVWTVPRYTGGAEGWYAVWGFGCGGGWVYGAGWS